MKTKIVVDSSSSLYALPGVDFACVPLKIVTDEQEYLDDGTLDAVDMARSLRTYKGKTSTSCPNVADWLAAYEGAEQIFVATITGTLSGSYNAALLAAEEYKETHPEARVFVLDSLSAGPELRLLAERLRDLVRIGMEFDEICEKAAAYRDRMNTYFVLDNLETLRKNGRLSGIKALVASTLSIKPVMAGTMDGRIEQIGQGIGIRKGLQKMADAVVRNVARPEEKTLMITHCNCPERAESVKRMVTSKVSVKDVVIMDTAGVSSMYANDGGVIVTI